MEETPKKRRAVRKARVLGIGPDGRKQYTVDRDARAGHRSATNIRPAGPYVGYELHLAVQTRDVRSTNGIDRTNLSDEVPGVVTCFSLVPAGTHRGKAIVDDVEPAEPLGFVGAGPQGGVASPEAAQLAVCPPVLERPIDRLAA